MRNANLIQDTFTVTLASGIAVSVELTAPVSNKADWTLKFGDGIPDGYELSREDMRIVHGAAASRTGESLGRKPAPKVHRRNTFRVRGNSVAA